MRIRWYDRILIALSGAALFALGLLLIMTGLHAPQIVYDFGVKLTQAFLGLTVVHWIRDGAWYALAALIAGGLLLALWGLRQWISLIPKRHKETFFTATQMERGTLSIAKPALEHLVQKCVSEHPEMSVSKTVIVSENDRTIIRLRATMRSGVSMPKVTTELQREIIEYLKDCAGIAVSSVQVIVDDTTPPLMLPAPGQTFAESSPVNTVKAIPERITPEPAAIPIPLGNIVDEEPAVPVMSSLIFPDDSAAESADREADVSDSRSPMDGLLHSDDTETLDPMFNMNGCVGSDEEGEPADDSDKGDSNAVRA